MAKTKRSVILASIARTLRRQGADVRLKLPRCRARVWIVREQEYDSYEVALFSSEEKAAAHVASKSKRRKFEIVETEVDSGEWT